MNHATLEKEASVVAVQKDKLGLENGYPQYECPVSAVFFTSIKLKIKNQDWAKAWPLDRDELLSRFRLYCIHRIWHIILWWVDYFSLVQDSWSQVIIEDTKLTILIIIYYNIITSSFTSGVPMGSVLELTLSVSVFLINIKTFVTIIIIKTRACLFSDDTIL